MPVITYPEAREIVQAAVATVWAGPGKLVTGRTGSASSTYWRVPYGAEEFLVGKDEDYAVADLPVLLVHRGTGVIEALDYERARRRIEGMKPTDERGATAPEGNLL